MQKVKCNKCERRLPVTAFYRAQTKSGRQSQCKECALAYRNQQNAKHKAAGIMTHSQRTRQRLRLEVLTRYSDGELACACCNERHTEFLAIDHIDGGGHQHRKEIGASGLYTWLKRNNFPAGFRVLCHNCNQAIGVLGYCPHTQAGPRDVPTESRRKPVEAVVADIRAAVQHLVGTKQRVTLRAVGSLCNMSTSGVFPYKQRLQEEGVWPQKRRSETA